MSFRCITPGTFVMAVFMVGWFMTLPQFMRDPISSFSTEYELTQSAKKLAEIVTEAMGQTSNRAGEGRFDIGPVVLAGLARTTAEVQNGTWRVLSDLSCQHHVSVQITVSSIGRRPADYPFCAPLDIQEQRAVLGDQELPKNRLGRLAVIRDAQRRHIQSLFFSQHHKDGFVIVLDLDMWSIPTASQIWRRIQTMQGDPESHVICGNGNWYDHPRLKGDAMFYYDTLALVFLPDTWALHKGMRLIRRHYPGENESMVPLSVKGLAREESVYTQYDTMQHIHQMAAEHEFGVAPVRSCFGGMAIYKASTWLTPICQYTVQPPQMDSIKTRRDFKNSILRYAKKGGLLPCEHVVLHDCLHRNVFHTEPKDAMTRAVAIDPGLLTQWVKGEESH